MSLTQLELVNAALVKLGAFKIAAMTEDSPQAQIAATLYTPVRDALLSAYAWNFATRQILLDAPASTPIADFDYAFDLPGDTLRVVSVGVHTTGRGVTYRVMNNRIETNAPEIIVTYIASVSEAAQPPFFDLVFINRLAAELCVPLTENTARAEGLYRLADQEFSRARSIDAQQDTPAALARYSLIDVRG